MWSGEQAVPRSVSVSLTRSQKHMAAARSTDAAATAHRLVQALLPSSALFMGRLSLRVLEVLDSAERFQI